MNATVALSSNTVLLSDGKPSGVVYALSASAAEQLIEDLERATAALRNREAIAARIAQANADLLIKRREADELEDLIASLKREVA